MDQFQLPDSKEACMELLGSSMRRFILASASVERLQHMTHVERRKKFMAAREMMEGRSDDDLASMLDIEDEEFWGRNPVLAIEILKRLGIQALLPGLELDFEGEEEV